MTTDLQALVEVGHRRQRRRFVAVASLSVLGVLIVSAVVVDPTSRVGATVLAIALLSVLLGLLLGYRFAVRGSGSALAFTGLPARARKDLMKRLLNGGEVADDELQVADGLLTAARKTFLPAIFGVNTVLQLVTAFDRDTALHLVAGIGTGLALVSVLVRRRKLARRTDVVERAYKQRSSLR